MRILLTSSNRSNVISPVFPLGLAYLAGSLRTIGHEIKSFDVALHKDYKKLLIETIKDFNPDIIGISIRNLDNQKYADPVSFLPEISDVVNICKESSKAKIILGGSAFSILPERLLDFLNMDIGIVGEGEKVILKLLQAMSDGTDYSKIHGVVIRSDRERTLMRTAPRRISNLNIINSPDYSIFQVQDYVKSGIVLNIRTKRGCPFKCIYCTTPLIEGTVMRLTSPIKVVDELEMLNKDFGATEFYFTDNVFNYPVSHAKGICLEIIARKLFIKWTCITNPGMLSKELLQLMKEAGCYSLSLGNESGSPQMLRNLRKNFTMSHVIRSCLWCRELGITYNCFLLLGGPGENRKTVEESISAMENLKPDSLSINIGIRIYPNTELAQIARDKGVLHSNDDLLFPTFYLSRQIKNWIFDYVKEAGDRNGWQVPVLNK